MRPRFLYSVCVFFAVAAAFGAAFAMFGPVFLIRVLGLAAVAFAALGCAVQLYALRTFAPEAYAALRERFVGYRQRVGETIAVPASVPGSRPA